MSAELHVLRAPAFTIREMAASSDRGLWTLLRRPLLFLLAMGILLSVSSSTRVSARTVADGMISFAFVPLAEMLAVAVIYLRSDRRLPFTRVADAFLVSHAPWLLWILILCAWQALLSPTAISDTIVKVLVVSLIVPACWAAYLDLQFLHIVLSRRGAGAVIDLAVARLIGWTVALGYFFGIAAWAQIAPWLR
jgi:hypothetical protein